MAICTTLRGGLRPVSFPLSGSAIRLEGLEAVPATKSYHQLHNLVATRPGATKRLSELRRETLADIGRYELQQLSDATCNCQLSAGRC